MCPMLRTGNNVLHTNLPLLSTGIRFIWSKLDDCLPPGISPISLPMVSSSDAVGNSDLICLGDGLPLNMCCRSHAMSGC